jgi:hypothetical protein
MKYINLLIFVFVTNATFGQFTNVLIDNNFFAEEPSITINPLDVNLLVAGSNNNNNYFSNDGGATWITGFISSSLGVTGDPCLVSDSTGNIYYFHLSDNYDRVVCQRSDDNGDTYNDGSFAWNNNSFLQDKEWATVDKSNGNIYVTWTQYDGGFNPGPQDSSKIFFAKSTDHGLTFTDGMRINEYAGDCLYLDITDSHPFTGPNGEVYVTFMDSSGIRFNKSTDFGNTWLPSQPLLDSFGSLRYFNVPGVSRIRTMPYSACDLSNSQYRGNIYVSWTDQRNGVNNTDLFFIKSTDGGNTWTTASKINSDNTTTHQFRNAMTVDQATGFIYIVYYDRRNYTNDSTDVYLARSTDGGASWTEYKISSTGFVNPGNDFDGDYIDITAHAGVVRPIWTRVDNMITSIWTCLFNESSVGITDALNDENSFTVNPNPADVMAALSFKKEVKDDFIQLLDVEGRLIKSMGIHHQREKIIDLSDVSPGLYFIKVGNNTSRLLVQSVQ